MSSLLDLQLANDIRTISLFSGAGGLDIGAIHAGARILWANDMRKDACASYAHNIGSHIHQGDINTYVSALSEYDNVDLVIGGPPCQGFSIAGKMSEDDERSKLIWSYAAVVEAVKPKAFVMENVNALGVVRKWADIRESLLSRFREIGYSVNLVVLNACDYNVPQTRERTFFVGFQGDKSQIPNLKEMIKPYAKKGPTVREVLKGMDRAGTENNPITCGARIVLTRNPYVSKSPYAGLLFNGRGRPIKLDGYSCTLPASGGNKTPILDERSLYDNSIPWVEDYHKRVAKDKSIALSESVPNFLRRLTIKEYQAIQTFPSDYRFQGSPSSQYTQIGNAVPCNLAEAVCRMVIDVLKGRTSITYISID